MTAPREASPEEARRRLVRSLETAPLRTYRDYRDGTVPDCALCARPIRDGELYVDRRGEHLAHYRCVPGLGRAREPWQTDELHFALPSGAAGEDPRAGLGRLFCGESVDDEGD